MLPPRPTEAYVFCSFQGYESYHHSPLAISPPQQPSDHNITCSWCQRLINTKTFDQQIHLVFVGHVLLFCHLKVLKHANTCCLLLVKYACGYDYRDCISWKESCIFKIKKKKALEDLEVWSRIGTTFSVS